MKRIGVALVAMGVWCGGAVAAPIDDVLMFCKTDIGLPKSEAAAARVTPLGKPRGTMSGADAYQEAVKAAVAGQDETAMGWMQVCTAHDLMMTLLVIGERAYVLMKLKR